MKFLVVGGIGYLGGRLSRYLKSLGHHVYITTRRPVSEVPIWVLADEVRQVDAYDGPSMMSLLSGMDVVVHLAGPDEVVAARDPISALRAGGETTWRLLEALAACPAAPAFVYLSTFHVYGRNATGEVGEERLPVPVHPYALGKYFGEGAVQVFRHQRGIKALCVRLSNAFGAPEDINIQRWTLVFNDLCKQAVTQKVLVLKTAGTQQRNFVTLEDVARAVEFLAVRQGQWPEDGVINLGSRLQMSIREVAETVAARAEVVCGFKPSVIVPQAVPATPGEGFSFNIDRLSSLGFVWTNCLEQEVDNTLKLCARGI